MGCRGQRPRSAVVGLLLTMNFLEALNGTLLGLLIPVISGDFGCSTEMALWIMLGPMLTSSMFGPAIGMVADTIGRTFTWTVFAAVLMLSLPACGLAPNIGILIAARTIGGMSWAGCGPAGFAIMAEGLTASKRGIVSTYQMMTGTLGGSIGSVTGGMVITFFGWRYCFLLAMAPVTLVWLLSFCVLPADKSMTSSELKAKLRRFDVAGTILFVVCSGAALMVINRGNDLGWTSTVVVGFGITALVTLPFLIFVERRAQQPILPFKLLWADSIAIRCIVLQSGTWTSFNGKRPWHCWRLGCILPRVPAISLLRAGTYLILPIFLQMARGWTPSQAGAVLFCRPLGGFFVSVAISRYMKRDNPHLHWVIRIGSLFMTGAFCILYFVAHRVEEHNHLAALVISVLLMQAGGANGVSLPSQAILVARMPADRLANIMS